jgi:hypothetical protein
MTIWQSRSRGKTGKSDKRNTCSIVSSDVCFHGLRNLSASPANRILPCDFSLNITNNITRLHNCRNKKSTRPNLLNTDRQRPKYIDGAKLNSRNKHSVLCITIRHAIRHNTPCLTTLSHDHRHHDVYNTSITNYKLTIPHPRTDLHHRQQPVIQQRTSNRGIKPEPVHEKAKSFSQLKPKFPTIFAMTENTKEYELSTCSYLCS